MAHRPLCDLELPTVTGIHVVAIRRVRDWITDMDGDLVVLPGDVLFMQGASAGIPRFAMAGAPSYEPPQVAEEELPTDLDRAIDVLVEMKNLSEVRGRSGVLGAGATRPRPCGRGRTPRVAGVDMKERLELWVLRSADGQIDPSPFRGLLHSHRRPSKSPTPRSEYGAPGVGRRRAASDPSAVAFGDSDEVVVRVPVAPGSPAEGKSLRLLRLETETGFYLLAVRRGGRYLYRPRKEVVLQAGDELIATGPDEGHTILAHLCGYRLIEDDETGSDELIPV